MMVGSDCAVQKCFVLVNENLFEQARLSKGLNIVVDRGLGDVGVLFLDLLINIANRRVICVALDECHDGDPLGGDFDRPLCQDF